MFGHPKEDEMSKRGRYGKYGEVKRKANLRQSRILKAHRNGASLSVDPFRSPVRTKKRSEK